MQFSMSITKGKGNIKHNTRTQDITPKHINQDKMKDNKILINKDIKEVYKREFGEAVEEYNAKQKRKDRKIDDYYKKILNSKKEKTFHELIIQLGNKNNVPDHKLSDQIYKEFLDEFQKNNPSLKVFSAIIHNDESTPHMHLDYVPVAKKNDKGNGLRLKVSNNKAIKDDGYKNWEDWRQKQEKLFENVCSKHNINREYMYNTNHHIESVEKYKELAEAQQKVKSNIDIIEPKIKEFNEKNINLKAFKLKKPNVFFNRVKLEDYNNDIDKIKQIYKYNVEIIGNKFEAVNNANIKTIQSLTNDLNEFRTNNSIIKEENKILKKSFMDIKKKNDIMLSKDYVIENKNLVNTIDELISNENYYNDLKSLKLLIDEENNYLNNINTQINLKNVNDELITDIEGKKTNIKNVMNQYKNYKLFDYIKIKLQEIYNNFDNCISRIKKLLSATKKKIKSVEKKNKQPEKKPSIFEAINKHKQHQKVQEQTRNQPNRSKDNHLER